MFIKKELTDNLIHSLHLTYEETWHLQKGHDKFTAGSQMFQPLFKYVFCYPYCSFMNHDISLMKCKNDQVLEILNHSIIYD